MSISDVRTQDVGASRAAQELDLKRGEFELAVQLGHVRTTVAAPGAACGTAGRRRISRQEIDRLRALEGFPDVLRERVRTVGTAEGAKLAHVSPGRFTRLARAGCVAPVRFRLNRYRAVVWLYPADELRAFAAERPALLTGRLPEPLRAALDAGEDRRPRNWRGRRIGQLLHESEDPWERAAITGCVLDPAQLAGLVRDPYERACLDRLRPELVQGHAGSGAARETVRRLLVADHPDEIRWHRAGLAALLEEARRARPAPRPDAVVRRRGKAGPGVPGRPPSLSGPSHGAARAGLSARPRIGKDRHPGPPLRW
ncbi:DUF6397 family protein [Streptomyces sp. NPDC051569]|uniref:DUF6397 family protein n=1 Tax=Streptomyces sp. NPDC051569 TaxID=3365661 RepID=UPI00378ED552